jgi:hypothetical protein
LGSNRQILLWAEALLFVVACEEGAADLDPGALSTCDVDQRVLADACEACPPGTQNESGDDPAGSYTSCDPIVCGQDERVLANTCTSCPPGTLNAGGDLASGRDTSCDAVLCSANERVSGNGCVGCPPGGTNESGDDASGSDTVCDTVRCEDDELVQANACLGCPPGTTNDEGDDASGPDTSCDPTLCGPDQFVLSNTCRDCSEGTDNEAGDDASGADTMCEEDPCSIALGVSCERFEEAYLKASNTDAGDNFGTSIALDGDTLAVGADFEASAATGVNGDQSSNDNGRSGAVYVFRRSGTMWRQETYLKAFRTDRFGSSVALDGDTLAVGAVDEASAATGVDSDQSNNSAANSGAVYVFTRSGTTWGQEAYLKASNTDAGDRFGGKAALDVDTVAVGAYFEGSAATGVDGDQSNNDAETPARCTFGGFARRYHHGWPTGRRSRVRKSRFQSRFRV